MKTTESMQYKATTCELWQIVHDPSNMPAWNKKCIHCDALDKYEVGEKFSVAYEMRGKRTEALGELAGFDEQKWVNFRYFYEESSKIGMVEEAFHLIPEGGGKTELVHTVDFSKSTLPYWVKLLIRVLGKFGKKRGEGPLEGIAELLK